MSEFKAYFCAEHVYIDALTYKCGENITSCLNLPEQELEDCLLRLWRLVPSAQLNGASARQLRSFLACMEQAQRLFHRLSSLLGGLPLFQSGALRQCLADGRLADLLESFCSDGRTGSMGIDDSHSFVDFYFLRVASRLSRLSGSDAAAEVDLLNCGIAGLFEQYISLADGVLQVQRVCSVLLENYIHEKRSFLSGDELAACFCRYREDIARSEKKERLPERFQFDGSWEAFTDAEGHGHFALCHTFRRLSDFLYVDFFRGLEQTHLPKRCDNCGRYFLLAGGKYSSYCDSPLPYDPQKTCRSIGAKKRYGSKCKTDPVWLIYNRAYKAHYARYMKGKMSAPEFERWSRYAVSLREQAADGTLSTEQYVRLIKE